MPLIFYNLLKKKSSEQTMLAGTGFAFS